MALSKADIKAQFPLSVYNYRVEIGSDTIAFSEVSGLSIQFEAITYKESAIDGKAGPRVFHMPGQPTAAKITMKKGLVRGTSVTVLYQWISTTQLNQIEKKDIYVRLCDEEGKAVISWKVINAFPTQLDAPTFAANTNDVAIESMQFMGDRVTVVDETL
jgi:phage tail-like protein